MVTNRAVLLSLVEQLPGGRLLGAGGSFVENKVLPRKVVTVEVNRLGIRALVEVVLGMPALALALVRHIVECALVPFALLFESTVFHSNPPAATTVLGICAFDVRAATALGVALPHSAQRRAALAISRRHSFNRTGADLLATTASSRALAPGCPGANNAALRAFPGVAAPGLGKSKGLARLATAGTLSDNLSGLSLETVGTRFAASTPGRPCRDLAIDRADLGVGGVRAGFGGSQRRARFATIVGSLQDNPATHHDASAARFRALGVLAPLANVAVGRAQVGVAHLRLADGWARFATARVDDIDGAGARLVSNDLAALV